MQRLLALLSILSDAGARGLYKSFHDWQFPDAACVRSGRLGGVFQDDRAPGHKHGSGEKKCGQEQFGSHVQLIKLFRLQKITPPSSEKAPQNLLTSVGEDTFKNL